jgi:serine phosphatase RsbU (regulator of sigma subunit)
VANAGGVPPVLLRDGLAQMLDAGGLPLGLLEVEYNEASCELLPGDRIVLLSDGIAEARSPHGELWGYERLLAALRSVPLARPSEHIIDTLLAQITAFSGAAPHHDDMTIVVAQPRVRLRQLA